RACLQNMLESTWRPAAKILTYCPWSSPEFFMFDNLPLSAPTKHLFTTAQSLSQKEKAPMQLAE
ncbi:MAG: hypothetical protein LBV12_01450, partial [Puniceicoccales bacterium]|nr:hypothetical protein [Puniceicoccales bacterium]